MKEMRDDLEELEKNLKTIRRNIANLHIGVAVVYCLASFLLGLIIGAKLAGG